VLSVHTPRPTYSIRGKAEDDVDAKVPVMLWTVTGLDANGLIGFLLDIALGEDVVHNAEEETFVLLRLEGQAKRRPLELKDGKMGT